MQKLVVFPVCLGWMCLCSMASSAEWGELKGRIVFTGDIPKPEVLQITRDEDVCGHPALLDESLIVNAQNRGLQNVVIWLSSKSPVPISPTLAEPSKPAVLDNKNCRFVPRIVRLRTNQILRSTSSDPVAHNVAVYARRNTPFSEVIPKDSPLEKSFAREELMPIRVDCSIHAWMRAYLMITDHPYSAVTDKNGQFTIPEVPFGEWHFRFWHEKVGYLPTLRQGQKEIPLERGMWDIRIDSESVELGELMVERLDED